MQSFPTCTWGELGIPQNQGEDNEKNRVSPSGDTDTEQCLASRLRGVTGSPTKGIPVTLQPSVGRPKGKGFAGEG